MALEAARRRRELCERNPADPEHWANLGVALQRAADAELALERPEQHVDCVLRALEAHRESLARGGSSSNERDILALLRTYATAAHRKRDSEGLDWVAERLQTWLGHQFAPNVDAARCAMMAAALFEVENGDEREKRRATAVACLERAFAIDPRQTKIVSDFARDLGLADEPRIVELLAPK